MEEVGELAHACHRRDHARACDAYADVLITLMKVPMALDVDPVETVMDVWEEVRTRDYVKYPLTGRK